MTGRFLPLRAVRRFRRRQDGAAMVEFGIVCVLFFFLFFLALDFGRFAYSTVLTQKAIDLAVRTAVVRPIACTLPSGWTDTYERGTTTGTRFGDTCASAAGVCATKPTITCAGTTGNATAAEIWNRIDDLLPGGAAIGQLTFTYNHDANMGFLGGPYVPMVTVDINLPDFQFISPLGALMTAAGGDPADDPGASVAYRNFSMSLPAEDLNTGDAG